MFSEGLNGLRTALSERLASPLMGTFIVAWSLCNYNIFFFAISNLSPTEKIEAIHNALVGSYYNSIVLPCLITVFYIFLYPYPSRLVFYYQKIQQHKNNALRQKIDNERLLSEEESRKIISKIYLLEKKHEQELSERNEIIDGYKQQITAIDAVHQEELVEKDKEISRLKAEIEELEIKLTDTKSGQATIDEETINTGTDYNQNTIDFGNEKSVEKLKNKVLVHLANKDDYFETRYELKKITGLNQIKQEYFLSKLIQDKLIEGHSRNNTAGYRLTAASKNYLIANNLV